MMPVNYRLGGSVLAEAASLPDDRARAIYYRRRAEHAMRNYAEGRAESMAKEVEAMRVSRRHTLTDADIREAEAVGKRRWSEHHLGKVHAADEALYRGRAVFYAAMHGLSAR